MIVVDTNVIIDLTSDDQTWREWSLDRLSDAVLLGPAMINVVVFAELSARLASAEDVEAFVLDLGLSIELLPKPVAFLAGQAFAEYRRSGGMKQNVLADFFIGAHAVFLGASLLTRDTRRYRTYFPDLELISP